MSGIPYPIVVGLVRAHSERNEDRFRALALQAAARVAGDKAEELKRLANATPRAMELLATDVRSLVYEAPVNDVQLCLPKDLRAELDDIEREWRSMGILLEAGLRPRSRLLFYGHPGNGKTTAAAQLARKLGLNCYVCSIAGIVDAHLGASGAAIERAIGLLRYGHALILDECDAVGGARHADGSGAGKENNRIVSTLLTALDRSHGGLLIATTNRIDLLDAAFVRRFDEEMEFPGPKSGLVLEFVDRLARGFGLAPDEFPQLAEVCASYDAATKAVHRAARRKLLASQEGK